MKKVFLSSHLYKYIFFFILASVMGWLWEVLIFLIRDGKYFNRGFLYGPWLPVYGLGAVFFYLLFHGIANHKWYVFCLSLFTGSLLEYCTGFVLDHLLGLKYWDYSQYPGNLNGYICTYSILGFGIAGTLWVCYIADICWDFFLSGKKDKTVSHDYLLSHTFRRPQIQHMRRRKRIVLLTCILLLLFDWIISFIRPNTGIGINF